MIGDQLYEEAHALFRRGEYGKAVDLFQRALKAGTKRCTRADVLNSLGVCYNRLNRHNDAQAHLRQALDLDPNHAQAWKNLGIEYRLAGDLDQAEECYRKALALAPDDPPTLTSLGVVYIYRDAPQQAIPLLERAVQLEGHNGLFHGNLALAYGMAGRFEEAERALKRAVSLGYAKWEVIHQRIEGLKKVTTNATERDATWLPALCPRCGAPTGPNRVTWTGPNSAECGSCGVNLPHPHGG